MIFAGIDVNIITHEKADAAGIEAFGLWCWGMCYAQLHETDGRLPRGLVLKALGGRRNVMLAKRLVDVGLWIELDDGSWAIHNYAKKNQTAEEIQRKRDAARARKEAWKARQTERENAPGTRSGTRSEQVPERQPEPEPPPPPPPENTTTTRHQGGERTRAPEAPQGARCLRPDEPLTNQRRKDHAAQIGTLPMRDVEPEWRAFVDHRISITKLFASAAAVDADWRGWVRRQNVIDAKERVKAQNDNSGRGRGRGERQPLGDPNAEWLKTGSDL